MVGPALCHVRLHGYGLADNVDSSDWYIAMAVNGVVYVNASSDVPPDDEGFFTYILNPSNCTVSDFQYFNTFSNPSESTRIISYLEALDDGRLLLTLLNKKAVLLQR